MRASSVGLGYQWKASSSTIAGLKFTLSMHLMQQMVVHRTYTIASGNGRRVPLGARVMARDGRCFTIVAVEATPRLRDASASGTRTAFAGRTSRDRHNVPAAVNGATVTERGILSPCSGVVVDALEDV